MILKYSKEKFDGYTHVFYIKAVSLTFDLKFIEQYLNTPLADGVLKWVVIYSNSDNVGEMMDFLDRNKTESTLSVDIDEVLTKGEDDWRNNRYDRI